MSSQFEIWHSWADEAILQATPPVTTQPERLHQAIHYVLFNGGKRIRPMLLYGTGALFETPAEILTAPAAAIEMIHAYSLVHDDLPAMDDDDLRRGHPTCHKAFDEASAILAGDALQTLAFQVLAQASVDSETRLQWIQLLAESSGSSGMVGGQMIDLEAEHQLSAEALRTMHQKKTGALIRASILMGASPAQPDSTTRERLTQFSQAIGLAFQVQDDILDIEGSSQVMGKPQGSDQQQGKSTFVTLFGIEGAKRELRQLYQQALDALVPFGQRADPLLEIANFIIQRNH